MNRYEQHRGGRRTARSTMPLARWWNEHRDWVAGRSGGQRAAYRLFQVLVVLSLIIIAAAMALRAWIRLPGVPTPPEPGGTSQTDGPGGYEGAELPEVAKSGRKNGYYTFLVAGRDVASGATDTMMLFTYNTREREITAMSLLRDTMINTSANSKRLNAVFARNMGDRDLPDSQRVENGMAALRQEVRKLTGVWPDFYVLVEWEAIGRLVEAIGGVYFDVPFDMYYLDTTPGQELLIDQEAGYRLLDGDDAMQIVRFRKNSDGSHQLGDSGRTQLQRDFLAAVIARCLQPDILLKLPELVDIFMENVDTDLSIGNILAFAELAIGMDPAEDVRFVSMPFDNASYKGAALALAREKELLELLNDGLNPYLADIQSSDLQLMYRKLDGGFGVTNATLLDPAVGRPPVQDKPEPEPEPGPGPDESGQPDEPDTGGESLLPDLGLEPDDIFPEPPGSDAEPAA